MPAFLPPFPPVSRIAEVHETLIIGSGYGASVAAFRLAEAGQEVTLLEMGMDWRDSKIPFPKVTHPNKYASWLKNKPIAPFGNAFRGHDKFTGVLDRVAFKHIKIYLGRAVGGGSIVNGGMAVLPLESDFKAVFPQLNVSDFYTRYFPRAKNMLKVNTIASDFYQNSPYYQFSRAGQFEAEKAGYQTRLIPNVYDFKYMEQEAANTVPKSALNGEVIYGNNYGKNSLDKTYLQRASATGRVRILPLHQVQLVRQTQSGDYLLECDILTPYGQVRDRKQFRCKNLFLGAGSIGTTSLLVKSKAMGALTEIHEQVGQNWNNNGNVMTGRNFVKAVGRLQSTIPVVSIDNRHDASNYFLSEIAPLPINMETWTTLYLLITKGINSGSFYYDNAKGNVKLLWDKANNKVLREKAKHFVRHLNRTNGGTRSHLLFKDGIGENICYHPLGGVVLDKATDGFGRLKGYKRLYVVDSALIPGTIGANPFLTITALAEYCMEHIIKNDFD